MSYVHGTIHSIGDFDICLTESGVLTIENKTARLFVEVNDRSSISIHPDRTSGNTPPQSLVSRFIKKNQFVRIINHDNADFRGVEGQIKEVYERNSVTMVQVNLIEFPTIEIRFSDVEIIDKPSKAVLGMKVNMPTGDQIGTKSLIGEIVFVGPVVENKRSIVVEKRSSSGASYSTSRYGGFYEDVDVLFV